ncbi:MAG TPA: HEAT repeat domain-containing protein [Ktedonobacterales bacterium]
MTSATPRPVATERPSAYTGATLITATLAALAAVFVLVFVMGRDLSRLMAELTPDLPSLQAHNHILAIVLGVPACCAALAAMATIRIIWAIRISRYMRTVRSYCEARLRRDAPLTALGLAPRGLRVSDKPDETSASRPLADLLPGASRIMLLGATGAGKSTALLSYGRSLAAHSLLYRLLFGVSRETLPAIISLPGLARTLDDTNPSLMPYLRSLLTRLGTEGLGKRTDQLLRAGQIVILCDDYDRLDDDERERVNHALALLSAKPYSASHVIVSCEMSVYQAVVDDLGSLADFTNIHIAPIQLADLSAALKKRWKPPTPPTTRAKGRATAGMAAPTLTSELRARPLSISLGTAALAAALTENVSAHPTIAWSRAELLREQIKTASANTHVRDLDDTLSPQDADDDDRQPALVWTALAASLQEARVSYVPIDLERTIGENVLDWLAQHAPPAPTDFALSNRPDFLLARIERDIQVGLRTGVLRRGLDGMTLGFSHALAQAAAAAWWFDLTDDGLGRLNSQLLRSHWALPVALWTGAQDKPTDLAQRIFRFANSPDSIAQRAGFVDSQNVYPRALALSLASVLEGVTPQLARLITARNTGNPDFMILQQGLRDLLDACAVYGADPTQRLRLTRALDRVQQEIGTEFVAYLGWLARETNLDRLLRAQLITVLGMTATPEALEALIDLLIHTDPIMRQAVDQAFVYAGARAIPAMQTAAQSGSTPLRRRAEETLRLLGAKAPGAGEQVSVAARAGLNSDDAAQRRVAVTTLSAIGASEALNDVIARLDDVNGDVRVAAAIALGQLGGKRALLALRRRATSDDANLRLAVAQALGQDPAPASTPTLLKLLSDRDARVRAAAAASLGVLSDKRAIGPLRQASEDADPWVRHAAQTAIRRFTRI